MDAGGSVNGHFGRCDADISRRFLSHGATGILYIINSRWVAGIRVLEMEGRPSHNSRTVSDIWALRQWRLRSFDCIEQHQRHLGIMATDDCSTRGCRSRNRRNGAKLFNKDEQLILQAVRIVVFAKNFRDEKLNIKNLGQTMSIVSRIIRQGR